MIKQYIEFAVDNGYNINFRKELFGTEITSKDLIETNIKYNGDMWIIYTITSKEFIEAIARGIYMGDNKIRVKIDNVFNRIVYEITINQAIAIRDGTLEDFIINLGIGIKGKG